MVNCIRDHQILGVPSCSLRTLDNRPESGQSLAARHKQPSLMHCHTILKCVCMQIVKQRKEATPLPGLTKSSCEMLAHFSNTK